MCANIKLSQGWLRIAALQFFTRWSALASRSLIFALLLAACSESGTGGTTYSQPMLQSFKFRNGAAITLAGVHGVSTFPKSMPTSIPDGI